MFPLEEVIALLRQLDALGWSAQVVGLSLLLACYVLLLCVARRIGRRNIADLEDENAALKKQVAESNVKRRELRDKESKLENAVENLQAQRPEERLVRAAKEREHGNEELAIQLYQEILATFSPEGLCRCFRRDQHLVGGGLKTGSNGPFVTKCGQCRSQRDKPLVPI